MQRRAFLSQIEILMKSLKSSLLAKETHKEIKTQSTLLYIMRVGKNVEMQQKMFFKDAMIVE